MATAAYLCTPECVETRLHVPQLDLAATLWALHSQLLTALYGVGVKYSFNSPMYNFRRFQIISE